MHRALFISSLSAAALVAGSALAEERTYDLSGFEGVSVATGIDADIAVGGDYAIRAESSDEELDRLEIRVRGDVLHISRKNSPFNWGRRDQISVYVTLPALSSLDVSSGASATAAGVAGGPFSIDASSGASANVAGACTSLSLDISSGASVDAAELICASVSADASSGASAKVHADESVTADASTGANVRVYGGPKVVNTDTSTGGRVSMRD